MTTRDVGNLLRLLGPALQVVCLLILFTAPGGATDPGAETGLGGRRLLLYAGFGAGMVLVLIGNILTRSAPRASRSRAFDLRLDESPHVESSPKTQEHG